MPFSCKSKDLTNLAIPLPGNFCYCFFFTIWLLDGLILPSINASEDVFTDNDSFYSMRNNFHLEAKNSNSNLNLSCTHVAVCSAFSATSQNPMSPLFFCEKPSSQVSLYFVFCVQVDIMAAVLPKIATVSMRNTFHITWKPKTPIPI